MSASRKAARAAADLVIRGRIATLAGPAGLGWRDGLAIGGGRVAAVGRRTELDALVGPGTEVWTLPAGLAVIPALTDAHLHLLDAALAEQHVDVRGLGRAAALDAVHAAHRRLLAAGQDEAWILGHGWTLESLGGWPDDAMLDAVAPGRPVALWAHDHHSRWVSREAIRVARLEERPDPKGGRIRRDADGRADGVLLERAAGLVDAAIPPPAESELEDALLAYAAKLAALGVTSVHDPGRLAPDPLLRGPELYRSLDDGGRLPLRVTASLREEQLDGAIEQGMRTGSHGHETLRRQRYRDGWLKQFADGALGSRSARLLEPYEPGDPHGPSRDGAYGVVVRDREALLAASSRAAGAGIASQIHAIGDAAVRSVLDVLAAVSPPGVARHRIEHAQLVDAADQPRFGALGVVASVQPCHLPSDADAAREAWGSRTAQAFPLRGLAEAGALLAFGTDAPVEEPDPWPGIAAAVGRRGAGWPDGRAFHPEQAVGLDLALRSACLGGPRSLGIADEGHLLPGARADLLVVPLAALEAASSRAMPGRSVEAIAALRPSATLMDGLVVHRTADFDP
jgi:predicted amidohydrolase YtcJ